MKAIRDLKNELLNRREVAIIINAEKNPGYAEAGKIISEQFKAQEKVIAIKNVKSKFGRDTFLIDAFIYHSEEDKARIEQKPKAPKKKEGQ